MSWQQDKADLTALLAYEQDALRPSLTDLDLARVTVVNALAGQGDVEAAAARLATTVHAYVRRQLDQQGGDDQ